MTRKELEENHDILLSRLDDLNDEQVRVDKARRQLLKELDESRMALYRKKMGDA